MMTNISRIVRCHHGILRLVQLLVVVAHSSFIEVSQLIPQEEPRAHHFKWRGHATSSRAQLIAGWVISATGVLAAQNVEVASSHDLPQWRLIR
jgi:hypothetical protein